MLKYLFLTFSLISTNYYAQNIVINSNIQIEYKFSYVGDSTKIDNIQSELMTLYIGKNSSLYESNVRMYIDSIENNYHGQIIDMSIFPKKNVTTTIYKNREDNIFTFVDDLLGFKVKYEYKPKFNWILLNEYKNIAGFKCSLAKVSFGGRIFFAWYAPELPIIDGPYKFQGLPGLILDIYDSENYFSIKVTKLSKKTITIKRNFNNYAVVDNDKYYIKKINFLQSKYPKRIIVYNPLEKK